MALPVSVIVVSRGRPDALMLCLTGIAGLDYPEYEVIVVACPDGAAAVSARADAAHVKLIPFDEANISAARNLGIGAAAGEVVAFIDDDAVPEPLWLRHLVAPFEQPEVAAAGGYVIGRNGISFQWTARSVDETGTAEPIDVPGTETLVLHPRDGRAIKTEGTNMAVRRDLLAEMGGFDPAFRFFLDETDLNLRLAAAGHATAIVPLAQVHHGFAESDRRAADRTPRDLFEIGASQAVFLRKHCPEKRRKAAWRAFRAEQRARLLRLLQRGPLGADDVLRLLRGLDRGRKAGEARVLGNPERIPRAAEGFRPYPGRSGAPHLALSGWRREAVRLRELAAARAAEGATVTLILLSPTPWRHRVRLDEGGFWEQRGGLFGRSLREGTFRRVRRFRSRVASELQRVAAVRGPASEVEMSEY